MDEHKYKRMIEVRDWCLTLLDFVKKHVPDLVQFVELTEKTITENTLSYDPKVFKGLLESRSDFVELTEYLGINEYITLNNILKQKFGEDIEDYNKLNNVQKIIERGKIKKEIEFRLMQKYVSELSQYDPSSEQLDVINRLLLSYELHQNKD